MKTINKRDLTENVPKIQKKNINVLKTVGKLHKLNEKVEKVNWNPVGFKLNEEYKVQTISTLGDEFLSEKATEFMEN